MLIDTARANGQTVSEQLMVDTCLITRGGSSHWDDTVGEWVADGPAATIYAGKCKVLTVNVQPANPQVGETEWTTLDYVIKIPLAVTTVENGDVCTITASVHDPALVGRAFPIDVTAVKSFPTARRLVSQAIQS